MAFPCLHAAQPPSTVPNLASLTPLAAGGGLTATRPWQTFEGHRMQLHQNIGPEVLPESDREDDHASRSEKPSPDDSLEARERKDCVCLLSPPSSQ